MKSIAIAVIMMLTLIICTQTSYAEQKAATKNHTGIYLGTQDYQDSFSISLPNYQVSQDQLGVVQYAAAEGYGKIKDGFAGYPTAMEISSASKKCKSYAIAINAEHDGEGIKFSECKYYVGKEPVCYKLDELLTWCCKGNVEEEMCENLAFKLKSHRRE